MAITSDTKFGELLDNPAAFDVLKKHMPGIEAVGPMLNMARGMTLKAVCAFPQANVTPEKFEAILADLQKV